jgi:hypothetical protein
VKKFVVTILAFLYLGFAAGVVMNVHYCMGQLSSVDYGYDDHGNCENCGMAEQDGCCSTELKVVKLQDSHQWAKSGSLPNIYETTFLLPDILHSFDSPVHYGLKPSLYYSPPDWRRNHVYLHTSILRI